MSIPYLSPMPHPEDLSIGTRKPYQRQSGVYIFHRDAFDTEIFWREPDGSTYLLAYFEAERLMKGVLGMNESFRNRVLDMLWNFYTVAVSLDHEKVVALRNADAPGWEEEIQLQFSEG